MVNDNKRLNKTEEIDFIEVDGLVGSITFVSTFLHSIRSDAYAKGYFEINMRYSGDPIGFFIDGTRIESDEEFFQRQANVRDAKDRQVAALNKTEREELSELERLLAKHGDKLKELLG